MADQDQVPQGAIPPKVTPFAKPEGASPITPVTPVVPGAPRPITVRLRPATAAPTGTIAPAAPAVGIPTPPAANPRSTARVPVPEAVAAAPVAPAAAPATVRLRPVTVGGGAAAPVAPRAAVFTAPSATQSIAPVPMPLPTASTQAIAPMNPPSAAIPLQPQHPPTPGSNPLPEGIKPPSGAQVQAAKSKTSRISLDSAIGVAPMTPMGSEPKTIRLKRPTDLAAPAAKAATSTIRQTSRIPDAAMPTASEASEAASVTQKKTLKIKRPGVKEEGAPEGAGVAGEAFPEGVTMTPIAALDHPVKPESSVFTAVAVFAATAAAVLLLLLTLCLGAHAMGPVAGKNALASIKGPELPWPGRIAD